MAIGVKADTKRLAQFDRDLVKVKAGMLTAARGAAVFTAALVGTTAVLFQIAQTTAIAGDEAAKMGKRIGLTAAEVQELSFAAELAGASSADLEAGMRRLTKTASDADRGLKTATDAFGDLNIGVKDAEGGLKKPLVLFEEVADALSKVENDTKRAALAAEIFGRGGAKLIPLLVEGADGIKALREEARELGFVFDQEAADAAEEFLDSQERLQGVMEGLRNTIGIALIPVLNDLISSFVDWFKVNRDVIKQRLEVVAERIADSFKRMIAVLGAADDVVQATVGSWARVFQGAAVVVAALVGIKFLAGLVTVLTAVASAFSIVSAAAIGVGFAGIAPAVLAVVVAVLQLIAIFAPLLAWMAAIALVTEDLIVFLRGGDSAFGGLLDQFEAGRKVLPRIRSLVQTLGVAWERVTALMSRAAAVVSRLLGPSFGSMTTTMIDLGPALAFVVDAMATLFEMEIERWLSGLDLAIGVLETMIGVFDRVTAAIDRFLLQSSDVVAFLGELQGIEAGVLGDLLAKGGELLVGATGGVPALPGGGTLPGGFLPSLGGGGTTNNRSVSVEGDRITIQAGGDPGEVRRILEERDRQKRRLTAQQLSGGDI